MVAVTTAPQPHALPDRYPPVPEPLTTPDGALAALVDDHTHLDSLPDHDVASLLAAAAAAGVPRAVQVGTDLASSRWTVAAVERFPQLVGAVAIHPNEAPLLAARGELDAALDEIAALAAHPRVRAVGESGMDSFRTDFSDPAALRAQRDSFAAHVAIAKDAGLVLQIHDRATPTTWSWTSWPPRAPRSAPSSTASPATPPWRGAAPRRAGTSPSPAR